MIRFRKREVEWDFAEIKKTCRSCGKEYTYYVYHGGSVYHCCLECAKCHQLLWYYPEDDSVLDRYFGDPSTGRSKEQRIRIIKSVEEKMEALVSPCSCGGNYYHVNAWEAGVPKTCPHCGAPQEEKKEHVVIDCTKLEVKPPILKKFPVTVLEFYDDAFPDFSKASQKQLLEALQESDPTYVRHALGTIYRSRQPFPHQDELIRLLRRSTDRGVRCLCVELLGKQGDVSVIPLLIDMLNDKDHLVHATVQSSLLWITSQVAPRELSKFADWRQSQEKGPSTIG